MSDSEEEEEEKEKIFAPLIKKTVKKTNISSIDNNILNDTYDYDYDKYDIIDFLEPEYIKDWLNLIPDKYWIKYKKYIEKSFYKLIHEEVMDLVIKKLKINLSKYVVDNFEKITFQLLKYCVRTNYEKLLKQININKVKLTKYIKITIEKHDLDFNKYFYEDLYFKLEPTHQYIDANTIDNFILLENIYIHKENIFYKIFKDEFFSLNLEKYELIEYYNNQFPNIFKNNIISNINIDKKIIKDIYINIFCESKINNYDDIIKLKNIINLSDTDFYDIIIGTNDLYFYGNDYQLRKYILPIILQTGNTELVFKIINNFWFNELTKTNYIVNIMVYSSLSNNYELVFLLYNFFSFEKNVKFDKNICSSILNKLILKIDKKNYEYNKIIYEWINLGGVIYGYSIYKNYIESIKIKKIDH